MCLASTRTACAGMCLYLNWPVIRKGDFLAIRAVRDMSKLLKPLWPKVIGQSF
jgi:hypothetical protein